MLPPRATTPRALALGLVALVLAPLLAVGGTTAATAAAPRERSVPSVRADEAPRVLTPAQCRRVFSRLHRQRACIRRYRAAQSVAAPVTTPSRFKVGISFGNTLPWMSQARRTAALDDVVALGARSIRMDVTWSALQPNGPDSYQWAPFDAAITQARARGLEVLLLVTYSPRWAQEATCLSGEFCPPADPQQFARYAAAVAQRYTPLGVTSYEVWNEPNFPMFWPDPDPQRYRELLAATLHAIRAVAPQSKVLFGGLAHQESRDGRLSPADFVHEACKAGGCGLLDGISVHPYSFPMLASDTTSWMTPWEHLFRDGPSTRSMVTVLDALGLPDMPLEVTEFGAPTGGARLAASSGATWVDGVTDHVTEGRQAEIVADGIRTAARTPRVASLYVYTDRDGGVYANPLDKTASFGLRRANGTKKPAWSAMASAVRALPRR